MFQPIPLTEIERAGLLALLGGPENLSVQDEVEFTQQSGCPPEEMEAWLDRKWVSCDIKAVLAKTQRVGFQPVLLTRQDEDQVLARLFYPKKEALIESSWADSCLPVYLKAYFRGRTRLTKGALSCQVENESERVARP